MTIELSQIGGKIEEEQFAQLRTSLCGKVIIPDDPDYDAARQAWNLAVNQHPAFIIVAKSADDIAEAVRIASMQNMSVAVQATGHGVIREASDSLLISRPR